MTPNVPITYRNKELQFQLFLQEHHGNQMPLLNESPQDVLQKAMDHWGAMQPAVLYSVQPRSDGISVLTGTRSGSTVLLPNTGRPWQIAHDAEGRYFVSDGVESQYMDFLMPQEVRQRPRHYSRIAR